MKVTTKYALYGAIGYVLGRSIWAAGYMAGHRDSTLQGLRYAVAAARAMRP